MKDRLHGFGGELASNTSFGTGALPEDFPEFFANRPPLSIRRPSCDGPVSWKDFSAVQKDIENFKAALADVNVADAFMSAASPGVIPVFLPNGYYPTDEAYLYALADVMQQEYEAIVQAGFTLQLDCPDLAMTRGSLSIEAFRKLVALRIEVLNHAVRNIPPECMRMHVCWGNSAAPHTRDPELKDLVDLLLTARPLALSFVGANPRHEHEWSVWRNVKLPAGKILIPGVLDSTTNIVEHPDLGAERLLRYANVVGRENVIAGTDCGSIRGCTGVCAVRWSNGIIGPVRPDVNKNFLQSWPAAPAAREVQEEHALWCRGKIAFKIPKDDHLHSIKTSLLHAAIKQGLCRETHVTALADGAANCWAVVLALQPYCAVLECILDWFHIGKTFQTVKNALGEAFAPALESAKWKLWHGKAEDALAKLALLRDTIADEAKKSKMTGLYNYIDRNQAYLVNYDERAMAHKTYTSQVIESHIDVLINARHKKTGKMQWSREGADNVLQIRATMASDEWASKWQSVVLLALGATV
jgi:5-methyltetrahydropteroyltriglutamate--homocysteine methyltransferase